MVCARWVENPYYQYFGGEEFFWHTQPPPAVAQSSPPCAPRSPHSPHPRPPESAFFTVEDACAARFKVDQRGVVTT
jgi:hypothetical protein